MVIEKMSPKFIHLFKFNELNNWSVNHLLSEEFDYNRVFPLVKIANFLQKTSNVTVIQNKKNYKRVTVAINNGGVRLRNQEYGENIGTKRQFYVKAGEFIISKIDARNGAMGIIPPDLDGAIVTNDFPTFDINSHTILPEFLLLITTTKRFIEFAQTCSSGSTNRQRIDIKKFLDVNIPLPPLDDSDAKRKNLSSEITQRKLVDEYNNKILSAKKLNFSARSREGEIRNFLENELGLEKPENLYKGTGLVFTDFKHLSRWDIWNNYSKKRGSNYPLIPFEDTIDPIISKVNKLKTSDFEAAGQMPIISQENEFISGYTSSNITPVMKQDLPVIVFGDHTQIKKFIDFEFVVGADGVKILKPKADFDPHYFFYFLETLKFETSQKYTRHYKYLKSELIPLPPMTKQKEIVSFISKEKEKINIIKLKALKLNKQAIADFESIIFANK